MNTNTTSILKHYRGSNSEIEASFTENWTERLWDWSDADISELLKVVVECIKNAGFEGTEREKELQVSIRTTEAIVGLLATFSWTHSNPIWMHLIISLLEPTYNVGSITVKAVPSFQFFHACKSSEIFLYNFKNFFWILAISYWSLLV